MLVGLTASTTYWVQVRATNAAGSSAWSAAATVTTPPSGVTATTLVSNHGIDPDNLQLTQGAFDEYDFAQAFTTGASLAGYKLTSVGLLMWVRDTNEEGDAVSTYPDYSVAIWTASDSGTPAASLGTLVKPSSLPVGAEVNVFTAPGDGIDPGMQAPPTSSWIDVGTVSGRRWVAVLATDVTGRGRRHGRRVEHRRPQHLSSPNRQREQLADLEPPPSTTSAVDGYALPAAPGKPRAVQAGATGTVTGDSFTVSWSAPANPGTSAITDYDVRYYAGTAPPADDDDWIEAGETGGHDHVGTATTARLSGLTASTAYLVQVRARNAVGAGEWSDAGAGITTSGPTADALVSRSLGQAISGNSLWPSGTAETVTLRAVVQPPAARRTDTS